MVTEQQIKKLRKYMCEENNLSKAASKAGMSEKTARKYLKTGKMPGELCREHDWRTRPDPFTADWERIRQMLENNHGLQSKTLFEYLQREYPGRYQDGQRRTLERRIKNWRALEGPEKEVYFLQEHNPGELCASDYTNMNELNITISGAPFTHLLYHFVLTYSNWETGTICYSESFESLSEGLQNALWELGGMPREHLTDRLSAAVNNLNKLEEFTKRYEALLKHYGLSGRKTQAGRGNENGDVEQSHNRFKVAVDQSLMLRGSRDFSSLEEYHEFLRTLFRQLNSGRQQRFQEELTTLRSLPPRRLDSSREIQVKVSKFSTIRVAKNVYSQGSRLIGEYVRVRIHADELEIRYAGKLIEKVPRLRGESKHSIQYRHIVHSLVKKPGAFEKYVYRDALFPSTYFRMAYDALKGINPARASREYLQILKLAADESEADTEIALRLLLDEDHNISFDAVQNIVASQQEATAITDVKIDDVSLGDYDKLLDNEEDAA